MANLVGFSMRQYLPLFLLMGLLAVASVSSTDYLFAYGNVGDIWSLSAGDDAYQEELYDTYIGISGYIAAGTEYEFLPVFKTPDSEDVKFMVRRNTRCTVIDVKADIDFEMKDHLKIVIDEGSHRRETGWIYVIIFCVEPVED